MTIDRPVSMRITIDNASHGGQDSNSTHLRPPTDWLPDSLTDLLADFDRFSKEHQQATVRLQELNGPQQDQEAEAADREANAAARRAGKTVKSPTLHRDQLAADRNATSEEIATTAIVVRRVSGELSTARNKAAENPIWREHVEDTRRAAIAAIDALLPLVDALVNVEAVDLWLSSIGPGYNPRSAINLGDLVPGLRNRGITRDEAGAIGLTDVLRVLRDNL